MPHNVTPLWTPLYWHRRLLDRRVREVVPHFVAKIQQRLGADTIRILDVGCGGMPYRNYFEQQSGVLYYGADISIGGNKVDVEVNDKTQRIEAANESFDGVVHFQVLEHIAAFEVFLSECWRVLRPGGAMFCTVPFAFEFHGVPSDYRRWTGEGLRFDLERSGFESIQVTTIESDCLSVLSIVELLIANKFGYFWTKPVFMILNVLGFAARFSDRGRIPLTNAVFCWKSSGK